MAYGPAPAARRPTYAEQKSEFGLSDKLAVLFVGPINAIGFPWVEEHQETRTEPELRNRVGERTRPACRFGRPAPPNSY